MTEPKNEATEKEVAESPAAAARSYTKTPLFQAFNALRYQRQALIRELQQSTGRKLICYVSGAATSVHREDNVCLTDLLHNLERNQDVDLLLQTPGGDIDAAEKLITMVRQKVGTAQFRVIVPDYAKSAGTLIALGADCILMSDSSELGPIDPQVLRRDRNGNLMMHSVMDYLDAYDKYAAALKVDPADVEAQLMLSKMDPETAVLFRGIMRRARELAEKLLKRGMMKDSGNCTAAVSALLERARFQTHGQPISWEDASDTKIGLTVEYLAPENELWQKMWMLYCQQKLAVKDGQKLFESDIASLVVDSSAALN